MGDHHRGDNTARLGNQAKSDLITDLLTVRVYDLRNPFIIHRLFATQNVAIMVEWLQRHSLLRQSLWCSSCEKDCTIVSRNKLRECLSFRCSGNANCEITIRKDSFFQQFRLSIGDIFIFIINYLDGVSVIKTSERSGTNYSNTAPRWCKVIRTIMMDRVHREYFEGQFLFTNTCQLDECCLCRKTKYNRGETRGPAA